MSLSSGANEQLIRRFYEEVWHKGNVGGGQPPTGRRVKFSGVNLFRFSNGKVVEIWNHRDDLGLMEQTGSRIYAGAPNERQTPG